MIVRNDLSLAGESKVKLQHRKSEIRNRKSCTHIESIAWFRWSRWPWQMTYAKRLDQTQTHMISLLFPCQPAPSERPDDYLRRRSMLGGRLAARCGRWSVSWAQSVRKWHAHVEWAHDKKDWCSFVYGYRSFAWLTARRLQHSWRNEANRTNTRVTRGKPAKRYFEGYLEALFVY